MRAPSTIVLTGAAGNIGGKLRTHLRAGGDHALRLIDRDPRGDAEILRADLAVYEESWASRFEGADVIVHLAANPDPAAPWDALVGANVDTVLNVFLAARRHRVPRVVLASSVWAMAARMDDEAIIAAAVDADPAASKYGATKLFAERVALSFWRTAGISTIVVRLGGCRAGANEPRRWTRWDDDCWLSNGDMCRGLERAIASDRQGVTIVNLTSINPSSRWSLEEARDMLGYVPRDRFDPPPVTEAPVTEARPRSPIRRALSAARRWGARAWPHSGRGSE